MRTPLVSWIQPLALALVATATLGVSAHASVSTPAATPAVLLDRGSADLEVTPAHHRASKRSLRRSSRRFARGSRYYYYSPRYGYRRGYGYRPYAYGYRPYGFRSRGFRRGFRY